MLIGVIFTKCKPPMDNVGRRRISSAVLPDFPSASHGLDQSLFFTEVVMDVEKLLITQMPNVVKAFLPGGCYVGLVDYE
uniref:Uncharacterized protein n=1 Tax=Parascaris equorum TaxID=6256 RepID=A0A914RW01_PAREQ